MTALHQDKKLKVEPKVSPDVEIVTKGLINPHERVTIGIMIDPDITSKLKTRENVIRACSKHIIEKMKQVRGLVLCNGIKFFMACSVKTSTGTMVCPNHTYDRYEIVVQSNQVRSLLSMCLEMCLEYFVWEDPNPAPSESMYKGIEYRFPEYDGAISQKDTQFLFDSWIHARKAGSLVSCPSKFDDKKRHMLEARFTYHNFLQSSSISENNHPPHKLLLSKRLDIQKCKKVFFFLFILLS